MLNTCSQCGNYHQEKKIEHIEGISYTICPDCGHQQRFRQMPLFILTGPSGAGKSTVCLELMMRSTDFIVIECDLFWNETYNTPEDDYLAFRNHCLRVCKNVAQSGKPVILCGSSIPEQYEKCPERRYFSYVHYAAIVCSDEKLTLRLKARPDYRNCGSDEFIQNHIGFKNWFIKNNDGKYRIELFDNSEESVSETADKVEKWIKCILKL